MTGCDREMFVTMKYLRSLAASVLAAIVLLLSSSWACASQTPTVVVSIKPLHSLLAGLMRGIEEPTLLIDGSMPPWRHKADAVQRQLLIAADIVIWSGEELEPGLSGPIAERGPNAMTFEVLGSNTLKVLHSRHDGDLRDPFYWLDSRNMLLLLDDFARMLIEFDPKHALVYERNWQRMAEALSAIDRVMEYGYRDVSGVPVFFYHDTHQYFSQAYAMHLAGVAAAVGSASVDAARLLETRRAIQAAGATCLFTEKGMDEPHLDLLLAAPNVVVVELDSIGSAMPAGADLYIDLMRANFDAISRCVRGLKATQPGSQAASSTPDISASPDRLMPRYLMMDQFGHSVSNDDFPGKLQLIYFGYTYCPDICPTSLAVMAQALSILGEDAEQIQPIFITVDPQRDTPALLAEYVAYFHPRMLGLSASQAATKRIAELFRARYERVNAESGDPERYTMDHAASLFLLGKQGEFLTKFAHGLPAREVAKRLRDYLRN